MSTDEVDEEWEDLEGMAVINRHIACSSQEFASEFYGVISCAIFQTSFLEFIKYALEYNDISITSPFKPDW